MPGTMEPIATVGHLRPLACGTFAAATMAKVEDRLITGAKPGSNWPERRAEGKHTLHSEMSEPTNPPASGVIQSRPEGTYDNCFGRL